MTLFVYSQIIALLLTGLEAGALLFVSTVSVRTFLQLVDKKDDNTIKALFPLWWPNGRDLMAPLGILVIISNLVAFYYTGINAWLISSGLILVIIFWTMLIMGEDIQTLRNQKSDNLYEVVKSFCRKHHLRLGLSIIAFIFDIYVFNIKQ